MPPKKAPATTLPVPSSPTTTTAPGDTSILSTTTPNAELKSPTTSKSRKSQSDDTGIDDLLLPRSLTSRIARGSLPANTSLSKDSILAITKSATVFISHLASNANELTSRKTIQVGDVMKALKEMELEKVMQLGIVGGDGRIGGRLERELEMYEESVKGKRKGYREKVKARESGVSDVSELVERGEDGEPTSKRVRRGSEEVDEEDLLSAQLNGEEVNGHEDVSMVEGQGDGAGEEKDHDETEDDPDVQDEPEEEGPEEEEEEEEEEAEQANDSADEDRIDVEESPQKKNRYVLAPDGRAEVGSGDESD